MTPLVFLIPLTVGATTSNPPRKLESLFMNRAEVTLAEPLVNPADPAIVPQLTDTKSSPRVLELTPKELAECRFDWGDIRLVDAEGIEVPYWLDKGDIRPPPPVTVEAATVKAVVRRELKGNGVPSTFLEIFTLTLPPAGDNWWLELDTSVPAFVAELTYSGDKLRTLHPVSVFRLADGRAQMRFPLGKLDGNDLSISLRGQNGRFLEPRFRYYRDSSTHERVMMPLPVHPVGHVLNGGSPEDARVSHFTMTRREGWRETELRFQTETPAFSRHVRVYESAGGGHQRALIGSGVISRLPRVPNTQGNTIEQLTVSLAPARGELLTIEIDNGDSPPMGDLKITAYAAAPRLLFIAPRGAQKLTLLFGSNRVSPPVYDLTHLDSEKVAVLFDRAQRAQLGTMERNPAFDPSPLLQFAWTPGAVVQTGTYSHRMPIQITDCPDGVARLTLPAEVVARARRDLADVRIIDDKSQQVPYLRFDGAVGPDWLPLTMTPGGSNNGETLIKLHGTQGGPVSWRRLRIKVPTPFVERPFTVQGISAEGKPLPLTAGTLSRAPNSTAHLDIELPPMPVTELELRLKEGDAAPLQISAVEGETLLPFIQLLAPSGHYSLLVGQPDATPPQYQLESVRGLVSQLDAPKAQLLGPLTENPDFTRLSRLRQGGATERAAVWAALGLGVLVLGAFTLRLLRKTPMEPPTS